MARPSRFLRCGLLLAIALAMTSPAAAESPLYQPAGQAGWDYWFAQSGTTYYAFYLQSKDWNRPTVGLATSRDLWHWQEHGEVLRANPPGQWNDGFIATGSTWRCGDRWCMLFTAHGQGGGFGLAESTDLASWRKVGPLTLHYQAWTVPEDPVWQASGLAAGTTVRYEMLADPYVLPEAIDGWYYLIGNAILKDRPENRRGCVNRMRSRDGREWEDCGIIALLLEYDRPETPQLWQHGDRWYLYVGGAREGDEACRKNLVYTAASMDGPFVPTPQAELKLPDEQAFFYIGKVLADPGGHDVFLTCIEACRLSRPYPVSYQPDGSIRLERPQRVP